MRRKNAGWSGHRKLARAAACVMTAAMLMQSAAIAAEELTFAEDVFAEAAEEPAGSYDEEAFAAAEDVFAAEDAFAAEDVFAEDPEEAAELFEEEEPLLSEDEADEELPEEEALILGEEEYSEEEEYAPEEEALQEEEASTEAVLSEEDALAAELFGEEETEEPFEFEGELVSAEIQDEVDDPVVVVPTTEIVSSPAAPEGNRVRVSHAGAGAFPGSFGGELSGLAAEIYAKLKAQYCSGGSGSLSMTFTRDSVNVITFIAGKTDNGDGTFSPTSGEETDEALRQLRYGVQSALDAFYADFPEVFWIHGGRYSYALGGNTIDKEQGLASWYISKITYIPDEVCSGASGLVSQYNAGLQAAVSQIRSMRDYNGDGTATAAETVRAIHDYVCDTLWYDFDSYKTYEATGDYRIFCAGAAFISGWGYGAVCEGYSKAVLVLCREFGIDAITVKGTISSGEAHMWNSIKLDGHWYLLDATWDDDVTEIDYSYFLMEQTTNPARTPDGNFSGSVAGNAVIFTYPAFSDADYNYCGASNGHVFKPSSSTGLDTCVFCAAGLMENAVVSGLTDFTYTGESIEQTGLTVKYNGKTLKKDTDYTVAYSDNTNAGTAKVMITGITKETKEYYGTKTVTFKIAPKPVTPVVTLSASSYTYDGSVKKPAVTVKVGDTKLSAANYTVSYASGLVKAGTYKVTVTLKGNYSGSGSASFTIAPKKSTPKVTLSTTAYTYNGSAQKPSVTVMDGDTKINAEDYAVTYPSGRINVGTYKVTVTLKGNYSGSGSASFKILPAATASVTAANQAKGIKLTWKTVTGATGYKVYRNNTLAATVSGASAVSYTDTGAGTNGTKYTFKIVATSGAGDSKASKSVTTYRVARPAISSAKNTAAKKMTVKWKKNAKATGYQIQYSTNSKFASGNKKVSVTKAATVSKVISKLKKGKTYYVRIRTYKKVGGTKYWSAWSAKKKVKISK